MTDTTTAGASEHDAPAYKPRERERTMMKITMRDMDKPGELLYACKALLSTARSSSSLTEGEVIVDEKQLDDLARAAKNAAREEPTDAQALAAARAFYDADPMFDFDEVSQDFLKTPRPWESLTDMYRDGLRDLMRPALRAAAAAARNQPGSER